PAPAPYPFLKYARACAHCTPSLNTPAPAPYPSSNVYACARTVPPSSNMPALALYPFLKYACTRIAPAPH
ncbi:hypothetical protein K438DRAFT_1843124, partial [Mycena galopus ATCC 62051]